jgi:hypothetical protein
MPVTLPPRPRQALHVSLQDWIEIGRKKHDRYRRTRRGGRLQRKFGTEGEQHVRFPCDQLVNACEGGRYALVDAAIFDREITTLRKSELAEFFDESWICHA